MPTGEMIDRKECVVLYVTGDVEFKSRERTDKRVNVSQKGHTRDRVALGRLDLYRGISENL